VNYPPDQFEVIVVDDGSKVPLLPQDLEEVANVCSKIQVLRQTQNRGVAVALNRALNTVLERIDYKYIARLDCGDLCVEDRFVKQVSFLDKHPEISLIGSQVLFKNFTSGSAYQYQHKQEQREILREMHFKCSLIHPSILFRRELLTNIGLYPENYLHCEDYAYFYKIIAKHRVQNINEVLLISELSDAGISSRNRTRQIISRIRVVNSFGTDSLLKFAGISKLILMLLIPHRVVRFLNTRR